jgi:hypothetical protein
MPNQHEWIYREDRVLQGWPKSWICLRCGHKVACDGKPDPDMQIMMFTGMPYGSSYWDCDRMTVWAVDRS